MMKIVAYGAENIHRSGPLLAGSFIELSAMRIAHRQVSFADLEFIRQGVQLEPLLPKISDFIDALMNTTNWSKPSEAIWSAV